MGESKRLYNLLIMIAALHGGVGYSVSRLADRFQVTTRSIYRYLDILRDCGFVLVKENGRFRIDHGRSGYPQINRLSDEELHMITEALIGIHHNHPLKSSLILKLSMLTDIADTGRLIVNATLSSNLSKIAEALKQRKQISLRNYRSPNSKTMRDRLVEPVRFAPNMRYIYALDTENGQIRQFKPERADSVTVLETGIRRRDETPFTECDVFGMNGNPRCTIRLRCSQRAVLLLVEELGLTGLTVPDPEKTTVCSLEVHGFEGAGRFVLGLPADIEPLGPPAFIHYLKNLLRSNPLFLMNRSKKVKTKLHE